MTELVKLMKFPEDFESMLKGDTGFYTSERVAHYTKVIDTLEKQVQQVLQSKDKMDLDRLAANIRENYVEFMNDLLKKEGAGHDYITFLINLLFSSLANSLTVMRKTFTFVGYKRIDLERTQQMAQLMNTYIKNPSDLTTITVSNELAKLWGGGGGGGGGGGSGTGKEEEGTTDFSRYRVFLSSSAARLDDLVGQQTVVREFKQLARSDVQIEPTDVKSYLLYGPPGTGKTQLVESFVATSMDFSARIRATGGEALPDREFYKISADVIFSAYLGDGEKTLRNIFDMARTRRVLVFMDEFETVFPPRGADVPSSVQSLIGKLLELLTTGTEQSKQYRNMLFIAATNHLDRIDAALRNRMQPIAVGYMERAGVAEFLVKIFASYGQQFPSAVIDRFTDLLVDRNGVARISSRLMRQLGIRIFTKLRNEVMESEYFIKGNGYGISEPHTFGRYVLAADQPAAASGGGGGGGVPIQTVNTHISKLDQLPDGVFKYAESIYLDIRLLGFKSFDEQAVEDEIRQLLNEQIQENAS